VDDERFSASVVQEVLQAENQNRSFFLAVEAQEAQEARETHDVQNSARKFFSSLHLQICYSPF
jgi:hypothetical protein